VLSLSIDPTTTPGGNPVTAVPGLTPTSPMMTVRPVFVTVELARTANSPAVPRLTGPATPRTVAGTASIAMARTATAIRLVLCIVGGLQALRWSSRWKAVSHL
jgi:hypothetical protein